MSTRTLYKHDAWNRFLQVRHGFLGNVPSVTSMILSTSISAKPDTIREDTYE
jgi:hypothetical protein